MQIIEKVFYSMYRLDNTSRMKKGLITIKEAAELFGVSIQTIRRWDKSGKLRAYRHPMNNYRLYRLIDLKKIAEGIGEK